MTMGKHDHHTRCHASQTSKMHPFGFSLQLSPYFRHYLLNLHLKSWLSLPLKSKTGFPGSVSGKEPVCQCRRCKREIEVWSLGGEDPQEEEMATYSSILAWRIQWKEEPGRLQCTGSQRVEHAWSDLAHMHAHTFQNRSFHLGCKSNHFSNLSPPRAR